MLPTLRILLPAAWMALALASPLAAEVVRIPADAAARLQDHGITVESRFDFGAFLWLDVSDQTLERLEQAQIPFTPLPDERRIRLMGHSFDPLVEEPRLPPLQTAPVQGERLRLIQLDGPATERGLERLRAAGLRILQYYPHHTYLVWGDEPATVRAAENDFVRWQGPLHPAYKVHHSLEGRSERLENLSVLFYVDGSPEPTLDALRQWGGDVLNHSPAQPDRAIHNAILRIDASRVWDVAGLPEVWWLGFQSPRPTLDDEMASQIVAGNHPEGVPELGYFAHLADLGLDGTGVIWSVTDSGVDYDHPDLGSRIVGGHSYPGCTSGDPGDATTSGHGTHVAGIIGGDATAGLADNDGFLYGVGIAPNYSIFAQNPICPTLVSWPPAGGWQEISKQAVLGNAIGTNNSWTSGEGIQHGYQATERTHDFMARDGNFDSVGQAEPFIIVFSAGNSGPNPGTLTSPKDAKNVIVAANSLNYRAGDIDALRNSSSRGPAVDGRIVPTIAAPGTSVASTRADTSTSSCANPISNTNGLYSLCTGTSMASPQAAGSVVLFTQWWREQNGGSDPSPALARAALVNAAVDMATPDVPNFNEGWGRIQVTRMVRSGVGLEYADQETTFDGTGEQWQTTVTVDDPSEPLVVTIAWSDAPGAVGANPALVNNLDLDVTTGGATYLGNQLAAGVSVEGGSADSLNNLEQVIVPNPGAEAVITVTATLIAGDGVPFAGDTTDQDFALVCRNCRSSSDIVFADGFESGNLSAWSNFDV
ncbi:MAG: S8 family serine peptidase [Acidobacteriota bacterium]